MEITVRELLKARQRMQLTQRQFARAFGFPVATLRHWERGNRRPSGAAFTLLYLIRDNPLAVRRALNKARFRYRNWPRPTDLRRNRRPRGTGREPYIPMW